MTEYIEREAALAICEKTYQERIRMSDWCGDTVAWNIGHEIKAIPAADVQPVRQGFDTKESRYFHCSECGYGVSDVFEDGPTLVFERQKEWRYCPNCGAHVMDGGDLDG